MLEELVIKNRSYRRFYHNEKIKKRTLFELIDLARKCPSAANLQPIRYKISNTEARNSEIFACCKWAGYLKDWDGPNRREKPTGYIIFITNKDYKNVEYDIGIAAQTILLAAVEKELGGCIIGSIDRDKLRKVINLDNKYRINLILALGKPKEKVQLETMKENNHKYWRDKLSIHHVPKRKLADIII